MLTPTILFNLVMGLIASFQYFTQVYVMTGGKGTPVDSTMFYALYLYRASFYYLRMGYASAMAWMLFLVILAATVAVLISSKRWVYYQGD
jgi:multiple sugar transport system permease protein